MVRLILSPPRLPALSTGGASLLHVPLLGGLFQPHPTRLLSSAPEFLQTCSRLPPPKNPQPWGLSEVPARLWLPLALGRAHTGPASLPSLFWPSTPIPSPRLRHPESSRPGEHALPFSQVQACVQAAPPAAVSPIAPGPSELVRGLLCAHPRPLFALSPHLSHGGWQLVSWSVLFALCSST